MILEPCRAQLRPSETRAVADLSNPAQLRYDRGWPTRNVRKARAILRAFGGSMRYGLLGGRGSDDA